MSHDTTQHRYEQMLANSATAAVCIRADNLIVSWNTAAEQLFGHRAEQVIGKPLSIIIPPRLRAAHDAGLARAVQTGQARLAGRSVDILALRADGSETPVDLSLSMWFEDGKPMFGALLRDIADRHSAKQRLEHLAHCDTLTSLPNRNALHERLAAEIARAPCSLLLLDLDGFKHVNDTLGHSVGDKLLTAVGARLAAAVGAAGYVARLGGDEFAILLSDCADPLTLDKLTSRIFQGLQPPFELAEQSIYVGTSIGIALSPNDASDVEQLLSCADLALYSAKSDGGGGRKFFARAMQNTSEQRHRLSSELRRALENDEFELWYQPQICLATGSLSGVEALLRWRHPDHDLLTPAAFINVLEDSAIAEEVGDWIVDQACSAVAEWERGGLGSLRVGVNLFAAQLRSGRLFGVASSALQKHGLSPAQLELEITETTVLRHSNQSTKALRKLRSLGVGVAFDDFGTGFASLSLLQKYPLTRLKIDRSFVAHIDRKVGDAAIVKAIIIMAAGLKLEVIAEGVETVEQELALIRLGCGEAQGYRYGRPMRAAEIMDAYLPKARLIDTPYDAKSNARSVASILGQRSKYC
ncbi:EAL domain-containing protein [Sphingomonas sp. So64.6b]|uniref:putative bifunctional diguanylate cyclase/phosphodiesterase n=1 Tax=Sphingomonas sp. So64.6b TaxID=2997354 RepID=UPI0016039C12|nr:EAL domain-containing protein [Sphingomonas sp. So64.6b]QNA83964.1 EAL domain-containing protein [Sphingomonas sp. So64.6b]